MERLKTYLLAVMTACAALAIGFVMQHGATPQAVQSAEAAPLVVSGITETSSALSPRLPATRAAYRVPAQLSLAALRTGPAPDRAASLQAAAASPDCMVTARAKVGIGAMVALEVMAPCYRSERVTIHHQGMMFTEITRPDGSLRVTVPALAESALFIVSFGNGDGAIARAEVPVLPYYDRVVLQGQGGSGLGLHALEFGAGYRDEGHVWSERTGDVERAAQGDGGFLTRLGNSLVPGALVAEVYSFPTGAAKREGSVALSVEAEVTAGNCGTTVEAQMLDRRGFGRLGVNDLSLDMPACDGGVGDFLVLNNLVEDLKIAAR
ncbi:translocase [Salipiger thiooxidans]|uniref:translocase n=1 Tax=Salipiger thiooxidans TaxID=282683 RepID=UPI001CD71AEF|nr:translocase [Salipiger thiooxidans]MCA0846476.1 translocase [Salipiger thiooxidans]